MSETKASKIIKTLHDNDLATSVFKAAIENDERLFLETLYYANLDVEDLTLSDVEFDNFVKGTKPSGELDLITWEGYYEANVGTNMDDPLAFLILSTTGGVYWGSRTQIMNQPGDYAVDYTLTYDGKINFSTPNNGDVAMTFTRTTDDTTDEINVKFSAVCGGQIVSGGKVNAPLQLTTARTLINPSIGRTLTIRTPLSLLIIRINQSTGKNISPRSPLSWLDIYNMVGTGITIVTSIPFFYKCVRWVMGTDTERAVQSQRTRRQLDEEESIESVGLLTEYRARPPNLDVNFDLAGRKITDEISSVINGMNLLGNIDWRKSPDEIVRDLREMARTTGEETLYNYVESRIRVDINRMLDPFISVPTYQTFKEEALKTAIRERIDPKLRDLGTEAYDLLIRSVILPARQRAFSKNYKDYEEAYDGRELAYSNAIKDRKDTENKIADVEKDIENAETDAEREEHLERREELREELDQREAYENESLQARDEAKRAKDKAAEDSREADKHVQEDNLESQKQWNKKLEEVFKK